MVILCCFGGIFDKEYKFVLPLITKYIIFVHFDLGIQICHSYHHVTTNIDVKFGHLFKGGLLKIIANLIWIIILPFEARKYS